MQIRATLTPQEYREAAVLARPKYFWLRFFAANWYFSIIGLFVFGLAVNSAIHGDDTHFGNTFAILIVCGGFIAFSWYRYTARLDKNADAENKLRSTLSLDDDGVRTKLSTGPEVFIPWSSYSKWVEGQNIFLLTAETGVTILPDDGSSRDAVRTLLSRKIS